MAIPAAGMTISWNGSAVPQPISISVSGASANVIDVTGRDTGYANIYETSGCDLGSVTVEAYGQSFNLDVIGVKATLTISGPFTWSVPAIFEGYDVNCSVGEAIRFSFRFKISGAAG